MTGDYFASGGNDNNLHVFSLKIDLPILKKTHKAAIKALDWSKNKQYILASGAGTADKRLRLWNIKNNEILMEKDCSTQICNLIMDELSDNIITGHGYPSNEICFWDSHS